MMDEVQNAISPGRAEEIALNSYWVGMTNSNSCYPSGESRTVRRFASHSTHMTFWVLMVGGGGGKTTRRREGASRRRLGTRKANSSQTWLGLAACAVAASEGSSFCGSQAWDWPFASCAWHRCVMSYSLHFEGLSLSQGAWNILYACMCICLYLFIFTLAGPLSIPVSRGHQSLG